MTEEVASPHEMNPSPKLKGTFWGKDIRSILLALEDQSGPTSPRQLLIDLFDSAMRAFGPDVLQDEQWDIADRTANDLRNNTATAPIVLFFLKALSRYVDQVRDKPKPTATELRAALAQAFCLTRKDQRGGVVRGAPKTTDADRIQTFFEDALYEAAMSGFSATLCNEKALAHAFQRRYLEKYRDLPSQRRKMQHIKRVVKDRDLAFDHNEDMSDW